MAWRASCRFTSPLQAAPIPTICSAPWRHLKAWPSVGGTSRQKDCTSADSGGATEGPQLTRQPMPARSGGWGREGTLAAGIHERGGEADVGGLHDAEPQLLLLARLAEVVAVAPQTQQGVAVVLADVSAQLLQVRGTGHLHSPQHHSRSPPPHPTPPRTGRTALPQPPTCRGTSRRMSVTSCFSKEKTSFWHASDLILSLLEDRHLSTLPPQVICPASSAPSHSLMH